MSSHHHETSPFRSTIPQTITSSFRLETHRLLVRTAALQAIERMTPHPSVVEITATQDSEYEAIVACYQEAINLIHPRDLTPWMDATDLLTLARDYLAAASSSVQAFHRQVIDHVIGFIPQANARLQALDHQATQLARSWQHVDVPRGARTSMTPSPPPDNLHIANTPRTPTRFMGGLRQSLSQRLTETFSAGAPSSG
jgi:hypothetical protein